MSGPVTAAIAAQAAPLAAAAVVLFWLRRRPAAAAALAILALTLALGATAYLVAAVAVPNTHPAGDLGLAAGGRGAGTRVRRPARPALHHDGAGGGGRHSRRDGLLARLHGGRSRFRPVLRAAGAVRLGDAGTGARVQPAPDAGLLGAGRPRLVPADRLLVRPAGSRGRGPQGVPHDPGGRRGIPARRAAADPRRGQRDHPRPGRGVVAGRAPSRRGSPRRSRPSCSWASSARARRGPLFTWLPDAMEGPTPVSALLHSATMVAAGVFLVARLHGCSRRRPAVMHVLLWCSVVTALAAATMAMVANDIKRVLAYSSISQLAYMLMGLAAGSVAAGFFHLVTHAGFKALLFLSAGIFIHHAHSNDMREIAGHAPGAARRRHRPRGGQRGAGRRHPVLGLLLQGSGPGGARRPTPGRRCWCWPTPARG